jgi:hypothetical protein
MARPKTIEIIEFEDKIFRNYDIVKINYYSCGSMAEIIGRISDFSYNELTLDISEKFISNDRVIKFENITGIEFANISEIKGEYYNNEEKNRNGCM